MSAAGDNSSRRMNETTRALSNLELGGPRTTRLPRRAIARESESCPARSHLGGSQLSSAKASPEETSSARQHRARESRPQRRPRPASRAVLKRPVPSGFYLAQAKSELQPPLEESRPLLLVLDLNGTLISRQEKGGSNAFVSRPGLATFLDYLFANHSVIVWASAQPANVKALCEKIFTAKQLEQIIAVWDRTHLRLPSNMYNVKTKVYKQLAWIWENASLQYNNPHPAEKWSQRNTILLDDHADKGASEPHNVMEIERFEARKEQVASDTVLQYAAQYLDLLKVQRDVSVFMRTHSFHDWLNGKEKEAECETV